MLLRLMGIQHCMGLWTTEQLKGVCCWLLSYQGARKIKLNALLSNTSFFQQIRRMFLLNLLLSYIVVFGNITLCLTSIKISFMLENCNQKPIVGHLVNRQHSLLQFILVNILVDDVQGTQQFDKSDITTNTLSSFIYFSLEWDIYYLVHRQASQNGKFSAHRSIDFSLCVMCLLVWG